MDYNTRTGSKTSHEEKKPAEEKKADHEHEPEHQDEVEKAADTPKFGTGHEEHAAEPAAKTHSTSYTD